MWFFLSGRFRVSALFLYKGFAVSNNAWVPHCPVVYIVHAFRNGLRDAHHYIVGVRTSQKKAEELAKKEFDDRCGRYGVEVRKITVLVDGAEIGDDPLEFCEGVQVFYIESLGWRKSGRGMYPADREKQPPLMPCVGHYRSPDSVWRYLYRPMHAHFLGRYGEYDLYLRSDGGFEIVNGHGSDCAQVKSAEDARQLTYLDAVSSFVDAAFLCAFRKSSEIVSHK